MTLIPSVPRNPFMASVSTGRPARHDPTADSLSQTSARGTAPQPESSFQCPANKSGPWRDWIIRAVSQVHLLWSVSGHGRLPARATLRVLEPTPVEASGGFTYSCP